MLVLVEFLMRFLLSTILLMSRKRLKIGHANGKVRKITSGASIINVAVLTDLSEALDDIWRSIRFSELVEEGLGHCDPGAGAGLRRFHNAGTLTADLGDENVVKGKVLGSCETDFHETIRSIATVDGATEVACHALGRQLSKGVLLHFQLYEVESIQFDIVQRNGHLSFVSS